MNQTSSIISTNKRCNFTSNKSYPYLLHVEPSNFMFLKIYNIDFDKIIIFTDQNGRLLEIEGKVI